MQTPSPKKLPKLGFLYLDHVLRFFDKSNFKGWPDTIETVVYHWGSDKDRFINDVKRKNIEVLIGNVPATAYETFRDIARALPEVRFIPSLDTQFANKSKENVTHFCNKYQLPVPKTRIFYEKDEADTFLADTEYPKIIKKSYGPSNYGGYFVHKVDSYLEAAHLLERKNYYPVYIQDFVPMEADIRVMLIGHKPVCAFWRRPVEGEWLTNTSQGGSMDYMDVPKEVLDLSVAASRSANAEYWACDIAVGKDGKFRILECATAFAAFPYIRDWIGQYLMWHLSEGFFAKPHIPMFNWEELGKISTNVLRTMRYITFGRAQQSQVQVDDGCETFKTMSTDGYPIFDISVQTNEEWPSEVWNFQDNYQPKAAAQEAITTDAPPPAGLVCDEEGISNQTIEQDDTPVLDESQLYHFFDEVKGIGSKLADNIIATLGLHGVLNALNNDPEALTQVKHIKGKKLANIIEHWPVFAKSL